MAGTSTLEEGKPWNSEIQTYPYYVPQPYTYSYSWPQQHVQRFKGAVEGLADLPDDALLGDAYFIAESEILVVRVFQGWHHFDTQ